MRPGGASSQVTLAKDDLIFGNRLSRMKLFVHVDLLFLVQLRFKFLCESKNTVKKECGK